jgi:hypothetical protein
MLFAKKTLGFVLFASEHRPVQRPLGLGPFLNVLVSDLSSFIPEVQLW